MKLKFFLLIGFSLFLIPFLKDTSKTSSFTKTITSSNQKPFTSIFQTNQLSVSKRNLTSEKNLPKESQAALSYSSSQNFESKKEKEKSEITSIKKLLNHSELIYTYDTKPDEYGVIERVSLIKTSNKDPFVNIIQDIIKDPKDGKERIEAEAGYIADHLIVKLKLNASPDDFKKMLTANGLNIRKKMLAPNYYLINVPTTNLRDVDMTLDQAIKWLIATRLVEIAERDLLIFSQVTPNDASYDRQWNMPIIGAEDTWNNYKGSHGVVVAVIDSGIDYHHPDLQANIWVNRGEIPDNGRDDDNNGFIDDVHGYDFANDDPIPFDLESYHGTHCAGIIGAEGNNNRGVAGVNWNVSLMAVQVLSGGFGEFSDAIDGCQYAINSGVKITSNSYGAGPIPKKILKRDPEAKAIRDMLRIAQSNNVLFIAAAGNAKKNLDKKILCLHHLIGTMIM